MGKRVHIYTMDKASGVWDKWPMHFAMTSSPDPPIEEMGPYLFWMRIRPPLFGTNVPKHFVMPSSPDLPIGESDPYLYI